MMNPLFLFKNLTLFCTLFLYAGCVTMQKNGCPMGTVELPLNQQNWKTEYEGFGRVTFADEQIRMEPKSARTPQSTHASLVLSNLILPAGDFDLYVEYKNELALRETPPNPWELFWILFQYQQGPQQTKVTNYIIAKPNGIELGRASGLVDQTFLKTSEQPRAQFNKWHTLELIRKNSILTVIFDGKKAFDWNDLDSTDENKKLFNQTGRIGLYSEDAKVTIKRVCVISQIK